MNMNYTTEDSAFAMAKRFNTMTEQEAREYGFDYMELLNMIVVKMSSMYLQRGFEEITEELKDGG